MYMMPGYSKDCQMEKTNMAALFERNNRLIIQKTELIQ